MSGCLQTDEYRALAAQRAALAVLPAEVHDRPVVGRRQQVLDRPGVRVLRERRRHGDPLAPARRRHLAPARALRRGDLEREAQLHLRGPLDRHHAPLEDRLAQVAIAAHEHGASPRRSSVGGARVQGEKGDQDPDDAPPANHATEEPRTSAGVAPIVPLMPDFDWERPLKDLHELAELTGGPDGARRLAWSEDWRTAREWLLGKLAETDASVERDVAGNLWATIPGESEKIVVVGSHIDAVPHGGWLDGCLGLLAAVEVLRAHKGEKPAVTLKLIDWADEEGARFGRSLLGSSAAAGTLEPDAVRHLKDAQGITLPDALAENDVDLDTMGEAELPDIAAYLELHIEQGPRLEEAGKPAAAVIGCFGVERHSITFTGKASHAGSTPMNLRHDAFLAAARFGARRARIRRGARRCGHDRHGHRRPRHPDDHQRALRGHARPARVQARAVARHARRRQAGRGRDRVRGGRRGRVEADLADRPDPVRRTPRGPRGAGHRRAHRRRRPAAAAVRRPARRRRGGAQGAHRDGLLKQHATASATHRARTRPRTTCASR